MIYVKNDSSSYGIQGALRVRSVVLFQASSSLGAVGHPCGACYFKTVSNAIELAMIASSTALMQACKRGAPSAGVVSLTECSAEVPCTSIRVAVHKLSVNKCMRCSQLYSMRSVDHGCWLSHVGTGMRAFILWTGTRSVIEVFSRGPGRATCVSCVEVLCRVVLYARLHELQLSAYNCTFCHIGSSFYTDAQTL